MQLIIAEKPSVAARERKPAFGYGMRWESPKIWAIPTFKNF